MDTFDKFRNELAQDIAVSIAKDYLQQYSVEEKRQLLARVDSILDAWKCEQASADDTIEVPFGRSVEVGTDAAMGLVVSRRIAVTKLRPFECADISVNSAADLWLNLWVERYQPVESASGATVYVETVLALLLERDGRTMPFDSIMRAIRGIWIATSISGESYRKSRERKDGRSVAQQRMASQLGAEKKKNDANFKHAAWKAFAQNVWLEYPEKNASTVAEEVLSDLKLRIAGTAFPSVRTIQDVIKPVKALSRTTLARSHSRTPKRA